MASRALTSIALSAVTLLSGCTAFRNYDSELAQTNQQLASGNVDAALTLLEKNNTGEDKDLLYFTVSDIDFNNDINELANIDSYSAVLALTLVADFSLISTKTFEITSAFTAMGEGQDTKLMNHRDIRVSLNRPRVVRDVSKSLGEDVAGQLSQQLGGGGYEPSGQPTQRNGLPSDTAPVILR